jgi:acetyl esterase/lipase
MYFRFLAVLTLVTLAVAAEQKIRIVKDVVYGTDDPELQRLDAYLVQGPKPLPVVIEFHGGGWREGTKNDLDQHFGFLRRLLDEGVSLISADYRLTPKAVHPAQVEDAARVVQFVRSRAREWNLDPERIALMGGSAGGHLALWVGLHPDLADPKHADPVKRLSTRVQAIIDLWGPSDFTAVSARIPRGEALAALVGATVEQYENPDAALVKRKIDVSPVSFVSQGDPPVFIVHNSPADAASPSDPRISGKNMHGHSAVFGLLLAARLKDARVPYEIFLAPNAQTTFQDKAYDFLRRNLKLAPTETTGR